MQIPARDWDYIQSYEQELRDGYRKGEPFSVAVVGLTRGVQVMIGKGIPGDDVLLTMLTKAIDEWRAEHG